MNGEAKKQKIHERLQALAAGGRLTPDAVVADAKKRTSPLHGAFEWDDAVAGHKYRIEQARSLIQSHHVYIERRSHVIPVPEYIRDPEAENGEQGYRSTAELKTDRERSMEALVSETKRAAAYLERVQRLAIALDLEDELAGVMDSFAAFRAHAGV